MRVAFAMDRPIDAFATGFAAEVERFGLDWTLRRPSAPRRVLILVSKFDHCMVDLLYRKRIGELDMDVVGIVSNHPRDALARALTRTSPTTTCRSPRHTKAEQEARIRAVIEETGAELVVLARYMQVLSDEFPPSSRGAASTSTTASCPASRAPSPITRRTSAG